MLNSIGHAHAVLASEPEFSVPFRIGRSQHTALSGRNDFARMEGKARDLSVRLTNQVPLLIDPNLTAHRTGGVFDQNNVMTSCDGHQGGQIARHPHLMNSENGTRPFCYGLGHSLW